MCGKVAAIDGAETNSMEKSRSVELSVALVRATPFRVFETSEASVPRQCTATAAQRRCLAARMTNALQ
jgi:hypothetical protein